MIPSTTVTVLKILIILIFFKPEYLKIFNSLFLKKLMKKTWVDNKNIKGNISKIKEGELSNAKYKVKYMSTFIVLKKSSSDSKLSIKTKLNIIKNKFKNDFKKTCIINLT